MLPSISNRELAERMQKGEKLNLLDVRERIEYHTYNIGGVNIPLKELENSIDSFTYNKTDEIIVVCKVGLRSGTAAGLLKQKGYQNTRNLTGGLIALRKLQL